MSTSPAVPAAQDEPAKIGAMGRMIGALTSPSTTFADIARKPSWLAPVVLLGILGILFATVMNQRVNWNSFIRQQIEKNPRAAQMQPEQVDRLASQQARFVPIFAYGGGALGPTVFSLWLALIYWGAFNMFAGAGARFGQALGIAAHSLMPWLVYNPITMLVMFMKARGEVDPNHLLASNAAAFLGNDAPQWMVSLGQSIDVFWFWTLFLLATGFVAINPKKISTGKSWGIIVGVWLVGVMIKVGWAMVFSR